MKKIIWFSAALLVMGATATVFSARTEQVVPEREQPRLSSMAVINENVTKKEKVKFDAPILKRICSCESWGDPSKEPRQFDDRGGILRGVPNPQDIGACQINLPTWGRQARILGYDIYTLGGNIAMANFIYHSQGLSAWQWSESCWKN